MPRKLPAPWHVEEIAGGYVVKAANGLPLAYIYGHPTMGDADIAKGITLDEARRIARNIAKLPEFMKR